MNTRQPADQRENSVVRRSTPARSGAAQQHEAMHPLIKLQQLIGNQQVGRMFAQRADDLESEEEEENAESVQLKADPGAEGGPISGPSAAQIQQTRGSGAPLDAAVQGKMEAAFATSFADVRVHANAQASDLNRNLSSKAFTTGSDIYLRDDVSPSDSRLLAHELTHVVQQRSMSPTGGGMRVGAADDSFEREAESVSEQVHRSMATEPTLDEEQ